MTAPADHPANGMARADAREWFRDNHRAPWDEFHTWVRDVYTPRIVTGYGCHPDRPVTPAAQAALDAAHVGIALAVGDEERRRAPPWEAIGAV